uniref:Bm1216 n=1 Tax=Brugia malayi TaxID=6279 RepID=A0A1I9G0Q8_BRUMA|nr:Bm1216 [Brugia malayi]
MGVHLVFHYINIYFKSFVGNTDISCYRCRNFQLTEGKNTAKNKNKAHLLAS